jgi:multiple sugar transport system substrate-binding protein
MKAKGVGMRLSRARKLTGFLAFAAVVSLVAVLGAAGATGPDAKSSKSGVTTVTLSGWASSPEETSALRATIAAFQRANRNIRVTYAPISGDYDAAMLARFASRRPPDVFYVDSLDLDDYRPALEPLNRYMAQSRFSTRRFYSRLLNGFRRGQTVYGLPKDWSPLGMVVNTQMLQRGGVTTRPRTWSQFTAALTRLRQRNAVPGGAPACLSLDWARLLAFIYQNGGGWVNAARTRSIINSPRNVQTVNTYLGWLRSGNARTPGQLGVGWCGEALGKEKAAVIFEGNWVYGYMQKDFPSVRFRVDPMVRQRQRGNLSFTVSYSMSRFSRNKQAGWRLLQFLTGPNGQRVWSRNSGFLPSRSDVRPPTGRANFIREAPAARPWQFVKGFDRVLDLAGKELEKTFNGDQTVVQMLRNIDQATQEAINRSR